MNIISQNNIKGLLKSKHFFAFLCVVLFLTTYLVIKGEIFVKGDTAKALPVVVFVDSERMVIETSSVAPEQILKDGGVSTYPEDIILSEIILDPVKDSGVGQKIIVKKAPLYFVQVDGKNIEVRNWDSKVSSLVEKTGISLGAKDQILPELESLVTPGATIIITRINEADVDTYEDVPFETVQKADSSIPFGSKKVTQAGMNGRLKKTYRIKYKNGVEVSRKLIASSSVTPVVSRVIASGSIVGKAKWGPYYESNYGPYTTAFHYAGYQGKYILVTNVLNGKSVKVKIVDKGPTNGLLDLSTTALKEIGAMSSVNLTGFANVSVQLVD